MTGKKFMKKVDGADSSELSEMYLDRLDFDPSAKKVEELRILSDLLPNNVKDLLQLEYYERRIAQLNDEHFRILTGYGQCRGRLIAHDGDIAVCCCREMAVLIAYEHARYSNDTIIVPKAKASRVTHEGETYIVEDDDEIVLEECPFCMAQVQEQVDVTEPVEEKEEAE